MTNGDSDSETPTEEEQAKRYDEIRAAIKQYRDAKKTRNYDAMTAAFNKLMDATARAKPQMKADHSPPRFLIHFLKQAKKSLENDSNNKGKMKSISDSSKDSFKNLRKSVKKFSSKYRKAMWMYDSHRKPVDVVEDCMGSAMGPWQYKMCIWIFLLKFPVAWHQLAIIFLSPPIDFACKDGKLDKCHEDCSEHTFDTSVFETTIQTEWNLVCDRKYLVDLSQMLVMFGIFCGSFLFGILSDKAGRRLCLLIAIIIQAITGTVAGVAPWLWLFMLMRFLVAFATGGTMITSFVLIMELVGASKRTIVGTLYQIPFSLGYLLLVPIAYIWRDWRYYQLTISIPSFFFIIYFFFLPESPRWLLVSGKSEQAIKCLEKIAKGNNMDPDRVRPRVEAYLRKVGRGAGGKVKGNFWDLFITKQLLLRTICGGMSWIMCGFCLFGLAQFMDEVGGDIFINQLLCAAIQFPGFIFAIWWMMRYGRKCCLLFANLIAGICVLLVIFFPGKDFLWVRVILTTFGSCGVWICFICVYIFSGEMFPTVIRNVAVGVASMLGRVGAMASPWVPRPIEDEAPHWIAPLVFGTLPIISAICCLFLPETLNLKLPDTIEEVTGKKKQDSQAA